MTRVGMRGRQSGRRSRSDLQFLGEPLGLEVRRSALSEPVKASSHVAPNRISSQSGWSMGLDRGVHGDKLRLAEARSDGIVGTWERQEMVQHAIRCLFCREN